MTLLMIMKFGNYNNDMIMILIIIMAIRQVLNEEKTGFEFGPQSIYGLIGWTEAPYCQIAILFTSRLSIQSIHGCFVVPTRT